MRSVFVRKRADCVDGVLVVGNCRRWLRTLVSATAVRWLGNFWGSAKRKVEGWCRYALGAFLKLVRVALLWHPQLQAVVPCCKCNP